MSQAIAFNGHVSFPAMTARATLQVRPGNDVSVEKPIKHPSLMNPLRWSTGDLSRFAIFAGILLELLELINRFIHR
jgi:hypothetical protein